MSFDLNARIERATKTRRGLTLIELIVVLVILIGLGGLLVPAITNALTRTHVSTCAQNFSEITQALLRHDALNGGFGSQWDTGAVGATGGQHINDAEATLATSPVTVDDVNALNAAGILSVVPFATGVTEATATFGEDRYDAVFPLVNGGTPAAPTAPAVNLVALTADQAEDLGLEVGRHFWLGLGTNWTGLRDQAFESPVHFGDTPGRLPNQVYSRFGAVFTVGVGPAATLTPLERARFRGVTYTLNGEEFEVSDEHIGIYWNEVNTQN